MLSAKNVDYQKLKNAAKILNEHEFLDKIRLTLAKENLYEQFMRGIEALTDDQADRDSMAEAVVFFNQCAQGEDPQEPATEEKADAGTEEPAKKKRPQPANFMKKEGPSFEEIAQEMWEQGKSSDEAFYKKYEELYATRGKTDAAFIDKRAKTYRTIGYKRAKKAGTLPEGAEKPSYPNKKED